MPPKSASPAKPFSTSLTVYDVLELVGGVSYAMVTLPVSVNCQVSASATGPVTVTSLAVAVLTAAVAVRRTSLSVTDEMSVPLRLRVSTLVAEL